MVTSVGKPVAFYPVFKFPEKRYQLTPQQKRFKKKLVTLNDVTKYGWVIGNNGEFYMSDGNWDYAWCLHYTVPKYYYRQNMSTNKWEFGWIYGGDYELWYTPKKFYGRGQVQCGKFMTKNQLVKGMESIMNIVNDKEKGAAAFNANQQGINQYLATK